MKNARRTTLGVGGHYPLRKFQNPSGALCYENAENLGLRLLVTADDLFEIIISHSIYVLPSSSTDSIFLQPHSVLFYIRCQNVKCIYILYIFSILNIIKIIIRWIALYTAFVQRAPEICL